MGGERFPDLSGVAFLPGLARPADRPGRRVRGVSFFRLAAAFWPFWFCSFSLEISSFHFLPRLAAAGFLLAAAACAAFRFFVSLLSALVCFCVFVRSFALVFLLSPGGISLVGGRKSAAAVSHLFPSALHRWSSHCFAAAVKGAAKKVLAARRATTAPAFLGTYLFTLDRRSKTSAIMQRW